jgi:transposase
MELNSMLVPNLTIGLDLGDRTSSVCELDAAGEVRKRASIPTTPAGVEAYFGDRFPCRVVLEVGTHSPWVSRLLEQLGHEVIVSNPSAVYGKRRRKKRNDSMDAEFLARQGRADPKLLYPIRHRGADVQKHLAIIRSRDVLVSTRTKLINHVRGTVKSVGGRIRKCSAESFARSASPQIPADLRRAMEPMLEMIGELDERIRGFDRQIQKIIADHYPEAVRLQQIKGVGPVTALCFVLLIEDPRRFSASREVGPYFGLVPRLDDSSDSTPQLRITKSGDQLGRRLLVSAAQYILGPFGPECDLRRHGEQIAARGGKNAKKRAAVAVARKLAVVLHRVWVSGSEYDPNHLAKRRAA